MMSRPDSRAIFRIYAGLATAAGAGIVASGLNGAVPQPHLPAIAFGRASLIWIGGTVVVAAGLSAFGLSSVAEPRAGRRAVRLFALGHLVVGLMVLMQWSLFWREVFSPVVAFAPLAVGGLLLIAWSFLSKVDGAGLADVGRLRSRYEAQIREAARIEERSRLARDLHDAVKQQLFVIQTAGATAQVRFESDPAGARDALTQIRTAAREATTEMEALIDELQATPLENVGLVEAMKTQCEALRFRTRATVDLDIGTLPASEAMLPGTHDALYRVAQEALANVARHARATHVQVSLGRQGSRMRLRVADDGKGFDAAASTAGMGRRNMRTRAADIGGDLRVTSAPGAGTEVVFEVPVRSTATAKHWREAAFAGLLLIFALVTGLLQGQWGRLFILFALGAAQLIWALISVWRAFRKAAVA
jgi:signal transduction histidine kinase